MVDQKAYWVGFNLVKGIGAARLRALLNFFGDIETAWNAPVSELQAVGLGSKVIESLLQVRSQGSLQQAWDRIQGEGIQVLIWDDDAYPRRLKEIDQPPPVLYVRGEMIPSDEWAVAIVGTRRVTAYGRQVTQEVSSVLASSGVTVVSGLARGVDSLAHQAALEAGGRTLAVLGSGVDVVYPPEHRPLANKIITNGALISDYPLGAQPDGINFPPRNRIISGLSLAVVIVEAGEKSGALITAEFAADQGRDVFAVPGNINAPQSVGCNRLIQQGARPLLNPGEVLEMLDLTMVYEHRSARRVLPSDATESQLLAVIEREPVHVDEIMAQTNLPVEKITAALALMELKGMVKQVGGMRYVAVRERTSEYQVDVPED
ncbi:MAG: DNA protecting protein DprA [Chloroflexi bacterium RBG_16_52_11]|nr:MAG: DNA protecting protein DprA [Chloroflexi bacterium RBG_16_52_11]